MQPYSYKHREILDLLGLMRLRLVFEVEET